MEETPGSSTAPSLTLGRDLKHRMTSRVNIDDGG